MATLETYVDYFDQLDLGSNPLYRGYLTKAGFFLPSNPAHLVLALDTLISKGTLSSDSRFLDAGSGDGRASILASLLGLDAYGVEYNPMLVRLSDAHAQNFPSSNPLFFEGDFLDPLTYAPFRFSGFDIVFNYVNNEDTLAKKISQESPSGTKFLVYGRVDETPFPGLDIQEKYVLNSSRRGHNLLSPSMNVIQVHVKP